MKQGEQGVMFPSLGSPVLVTYSKEPGPGREMRLWAELYRWEAAGRVWMMPYLAGGAGGRDVDDDMSGRRSRRELPVPPLPMRTGAWMSQDCLLGEGC